MEHGNLCARENANACLEDNGILLKSVIPPSRKVAQMVAINECTENMIQYILEGARGEVDADVQISLLEEARGSPSSREVQCHYQR